MERVNWVDNAKGIGILLVILGHLPWISKGMFHYIFSFHMPLFFVIAGFFLARSIEQTSLRSFLDKRIRSLVVPFVFFGIFSATYSYILRRYGLSDGSPYKYVDGITDALFFCKENLGPWFLICLFMSTMFSWLIFKYAGRYKAVLFVLATVLGFILISTKVVLPLTIDIALLVVIFVGIGHLYYNNCPPQLSKWAVVLLLLAISLICNFLNCETLDLRARHIGNPILYLLGATASSFFIFFMSKMVHSKKLEWAGRNSLVIYCLHGYIIGYCKTIYNSLLNIANLQRNIVFDILAILSTISLVFLSLYPIIWLINNRLGWIIGRHSKK